MTSLTLAPRSAASDRSSYERAFAALETAGSRPKARGDAGLDACCPAHPDTTASLSGDWKPPTADKSGRMLLKCHVGCAYDDILAALDLTRADMFDGPSPGYADRRAATPSPRRAGPRATMPRQATPARTAPKKSPKPKADHEHDYAHERTHTYANADGLIVARIHRKRCTVEGCRVKTFRTQYPNGKPTDGLPLYGTPELTAAIAEGRTIHICEGEGDRDTLVAAGEIAVSAPFGADSGEGDKWLPRHTEQLRGARSVVIWADRDADGLRHAGYVANQLLAASVLHAEPTPNGYGVTIDLRIVYPAVTTPKADASEHLAAGYTVANAVNVPVEDLASTGLEGLATTAPATSKAEKPKPPAPPGEQDLADAIPAHTVISESGEGVAPGHPVEGSSGWRYSTTEGRYGAMWKSSGRREGRTWDQQLSWAPITGERLVKLNEDGTPGAKHFTITVGEDTKTVSVGDLRTGEAWDGFPDAIGTGTKPVREALLNCVETQGRDLPRTPVVTHTGWYDLPDVGRTYVFADGRTYPEGRPIRVLDVPEALRRAAAPLDKTADVAECRQAVADIAEHGWAGFMGLAVGARSLGYTLRPVPASFVIDAEPNSGKTSAANTGRSLLYTPRPKPWPPVVTKGFNSTITDIEMAVDLEGDSPLLLDDVALTRASSAMEVREMERKLELVLRAAGNQTDIRGRRNRDLTAKPGNRVRSIPVIAAQMLPPSMQESLYRRSVVIYLSREGGELDWRWYRDGGGASLAVPLRTVGERIIAHLHGQEDPEAYLADLEERALKQFSPYAEAALPEASGAMDGVVTAAAGMLAGFGLLADVTGLEMEQMIAVVAEPLAASLAQQARKMDDQSVQQDDLGTAVVEVVRQALATGRAHVRDGDGTVGPAVPGEVEQVQGVTPGREPGSWEGKGPAFYWLPRLGPAVAVRSVELHTLLCASTDPRVRGISSRSLPAALLQAGLTIPSTQKDRVASHQVRIGTSNPRVLLIKAERMWDLPDAGGPTGGDPGSDGGGGADGGEPSADTPPGTETSAPGNDQEQAQQPNALFDPTTDGQGPDSASAAEATTTENAANSAEEDEMVANINHVPTAPCVRCGQPTAHSENGQPMHQELPGFFRCDVGYLDPTMAHLNTQPTADQQPATAPVPAQAAAPAPTPSPRPVTAAGPTAPRRHHQALAPAADATYPNGPVAVLDVTDDGQVLAHLADGRTLDVPARSIPTLLTWALQAGLGQTRLHKWGTDGDPLVVLTPAATKKYGLPDDLEDRSGLRLAESHKVVKAVTKAGWSLTKRGFGPWVRIYKPVENGRRRCVQLAVVPWGALGKASGWYLDDDTEPDAIARTLGTYAQRAIAPRGTMASSGIELMMALRPLTRPVKVTTTDPVTGEVTESYASGPVEGSLTKPRKPAPCEAPDEHPIVHALFGTARPEEEAMDEEAWNWHRAPEGDECDLPNCVGIDTNTSFLSSSSRLLVGATDPVHHIRPMFDPKIPGAWKVDFSRAHIELARRLGPDKVNPLDPRLPSPFTRNGEPPAGPRWYTTQTCDYARKLGIPVEPTEAWLREPLAAGWLDPWNERLAVAYKTTMAALGVTEDMSPEEFLDAMAQLGTGDPVERAVLKAVKATVKTGIGKLRATPGHYEGHKYGDPWPDLDKPWWAPDVRYSVIATARIVQHRKMVKTLQLTGRAPLAAYSDCAIYPTSTRSPLEIIPRDANGQQVKGAFRLGVAPGWVKLEGARALDWYMEIHNKKWNPARYIAPRDGERMDEGE